MREDEFAQRGMARRLAGSSLPSFESEQFALEASVDAPPTIWVGYAHGERVAVGTYLDVQRALERVTEHDQSVCSDYIPSEWLMDGEALWQPVHHGMSSSERARDGWCSQPDAWTAWWLLAQAARDRALYAFLEEERELPTDPTACEQYIASYDQVEEALYALA